MQLKMSSKMFLIKLFLKSSKLQQQKNLRKKEMIFLWIQIVKMIISSNQLKLLSMMKKLQQLEL